MLLNFGHMPRSGVGDLSVHLADHLAAAGLSTWRFDFPGLGDSPGETPAAERVLFRQIQAGRYVDPCVELLTELSALSGIKRWILGGLCGGAITSILAAPQCRELLSGLLLVDLDVSLLPEADGGPVHAQSQRGQGDPSGAERAVAAIVKEDAHPSEANLANGNEARSYDPVLQRLFRRRTWIRFATGEGRLGGRLPGLRRIVGRVISSSSIPALPSDSNQPLIESLCQLVEQQMPILSIRAKGKMRDLYAESVDQVCFKPRIPASYRVVRLTDTNHTFTSGGAEGAVMAAVTDWLENSSTLLDAQAKSGIPMAEEVPA
ncbi:MAG: hypothetical protein QF724_11445 [Planctomycetota bacterium]|nr:hypothetical protein [Planctomycetota bacterium]MDP6520158.1 hypothetical protein [Planctomycetota bacterium]MDP6839543.1 hypothetical protein [Planctomycetota bacterium]